MTAEDVLHGLRDAEDAYRRSCAATDALRQDRNAAVRHALANGLTHQQIADALGLSRGRIAQLAGDHHRA